MSDVRSNFTESLKIDYRWFQSQSIEPRFEFGFGLSYSNFSYSSISISNDYMADDQAIQETAEPFYEYDGKNSLYDQVATVSAVITNTGSVAACEVAQLVCSR